LNLVPLIIVALLIGLCESSAAGQSTAAASAWDRYQTSIDTRYAAARAEGPFFVHDGDSSQRGWRERLAAGSVSMIKIESPTIPDAAIHHWIGATFIPATTLDTFMAHLKRQAGHESESYDDVLASRVLAQSGDRVTIFMKLRRTKLITVTYNTEHLVEYRSLGTTRASARSVATKIAELSGAGTPGEREKAPGDDSGFLWRLNAYWRYEAWSGGVIVECESVSLSRQVPFLARPIANPIVDGIARDSLERTLRGLGASLGTQKR
jgi:hypothetical protein